MRHVLPAAMLLCVAAMPACTDRPASDVQDTRPERDAAATPATSTPAAGDAAQSMASDGARGRSARVPIGEEDGAAGTDAMATLRSSSGPQMHLVDASGASVYMLEGNTDGSKCDAACEEAWPPVLATVSRAEAGTGLDAQRLDVIPRADRSYQVSYGNNPLYRYAGDSGAGRTNGHGVRDQWGRWSLVGLDGKAVTDPLPGVGAGADATPPAKDAKSPAD